MSGEIQIYRADDPTSLGRRLGDLIVEPFCCLYRHRGMLWATTWTEVRVRYAGSILGMVWLLLYPLLFLGAYCFYIYAVNTRTGLFTSDEPFLLLVLAGLIPFLGFTEGLATGVPSVTSSAALVKNTLFPIELVPAKAVLASQCTQIGGLALLLAALVLTGRLTFWALLVIPVWLCQMMFSIGLVWVLSGLNVFFRDLQNIIAVLILLLMLLSPIAYLPEHVPEKLRIVLWCNPLTYLIIAYRDCLYRGGPLQLQTVLVLIGMSTVSFIGGYAVFSRVKRVFADNV